MSHNKYSPNEMRQTKCRSYNSHNPKIVPALTDEDTFFLNIGEKISYYRRHTKLSQKQLAEQSGISLSYLSKVEAMNVHVKCSLAFVYKISTAIGIPPYLLLKDIKS